MVYKKLNINKTYFVTGAAGFIGFFLSKRLLEEGCKVIGIDNLNGYYDIMLRNGSLIDILNHLMNSLLLKVIFLINLR